MTPEQRGPDFIPYAEWIVVDEKRRRRRSWFLGGVTACVVLLVGSMLIIPILSRRALIKDLSLRMNEALQVVTTEEHIGPNDVRFDRKVIEESETQQRFELDGGNVMLFSSQEGGSKLDKRVGSLLSYSSHALSGTPLAQIRQLLRAASLDVRTSVQKTEMVNGALKMRSGDETFLIRPGEGKVLATVDVQRQTDLGMTTLLQWRFDKVEPDFMRFYPANYSQIKSEVGVSTISARVPRQTFNVGNTPANIFRVDINEKGDIFIADSTSSELAYQVKVTDGARYAWIPTNISQISSLPGETMREHLAHRKRGTTLTWPYTVTFEARPAVDSTAAPFVFKKTFKAPTCSFVPDYEYALIATDAPIARHLARSYLCEASLAETGADLANYRHSDGPVQNSAEALSLYRYVITYFGYASTAGYGATQARIYYSIYRCYDAGGQEQLGHAALKMANSRNNSQDPWLDQKINEAFVREDLIEVE